MASNGRKLTWIVHVKKQWCIHPSSCCLSFLGFIQDSIRECKSIYSGYTSIPGSKILFLYFFCIWVCLSESHHHPEQTTVIPPIQKKQRKKNTVVVAQPLRCLPLSFCETNMHKKSTVNSPLFSSWCFSFQLLLFKETKRFPSKTSSFTFRHAPNQVKV